jgi:hypothetical protein
VAVLLLCADKCVARKLWLTGSIRHEWGGDVLSSDAISDGNIDLRSLAPEFNEDQHGMYVNLLVNAIDNKPSVRNIALTGTYGTGKSSILGEVVRRYPKRVVEISFSTVGKEPGKDSTGVPTSDAHSAASGPSDAVAVTPTNRIEKEIVKQILYKEDPAKTRGSRFRRVTRFRWEREVVFGLAIGLLVLGVLFLTGLDKPFMAMAGSDAALLWFGHGLLFLLLSATVVVIRWLTHNRVFLDKVTAGPATVSLSSQSSSYFDKYLDEIVYYFEVSKRDIVVFEDIDRFDDVHIFEALRALNTLLNGANQVKRNRQLKFVYALRDSVFEKIGESSGAEGPSDEAREELERANRTKFFDLVVPVVPFITHRNARDLMDDAMKDTGVSTELIDLAARHVADMRLIYNMRNEYDVFASKLLSGPVEERLSGLDADRLFSLVLYKNVHMTDFEKIRFGDSQLDTLHREWRKLVRENISHETNMALDAGSRLESLDAVAARSEHLGNRLEQLAQVLGLHILNGTAQAQVSMSGVGMDSIGLRDGSNWTKLIQKRGQVTITFNPAYNNPYAIPFEALSSLLGVDIVPEDWEAEDRTDLKNTRLAAEQRSHFLRHHTWQELAARPEFTFPARSKNGESFRDLVSRLFRSELARQLIVNGYINDYFALYVSVYYGKHLRLDALNYIVQHIDKGEADLVYRLTGEDVDAIIAEKGEGILHDPAMYNCSVMDHLLEKRTDLAKKLLGQMAAWGNVENDFAAEYLHHGIQRRKFVVGLAPLVPDIFEWLVMKGGDQTPTLIDAAIRNCSRDLVYLLGREVRSYFENHAAKVASLTESGNADDAAKAMSVIATSGAALPSLRQMSPDALLAAAKLSCYRVTAENLRLLTGSQDLALDNIRDAAGNVYQHVLEELGQYLTVIGSDGNGGFTVSNPEAFAQVIHDVHDAQSDQILLASVIEGAAPDCFVSDLSAVPPAAWDALAGNFRTRATFANVQRSIDNLGEVGPGLVLLLERDMAVTEVDGIEDSTRAELAVTVLASREALSDPQLRVRLAGSVVDPGIQIPATSIEPESGKLIGLLLDRGVIADDESAFSSALMLDWPTREAAIEDSDKFADYMTPAILPAAALPKLFASARIPPKVKKNVVENLRDYVAGDDGAGVLAAARYADHEGIPLDYPRVKLAVHFGLEDKTVVRLMAQSQMLSEEEIRGVLSRMGGDYPLIADRGTERPSLPDDEAHHTILERLKSAGVVSSYTSEGEDRLRVYRHQS